MSLHTTCPTPAHPLTVLIPTFHPDGAIPLGVGRYEKTRAGGFSAARARGTGFSSQKFTVDADGYSADIDAATVNKMISLSGYHREGMVFKTRFAPKLTPT